jgi:hypothetical protein
VKIFSRAIHLVCLIALAVFSFASSVPASELSSTPGLFAYDGQNQLTMVYDGGFPSVFDYDSAAVLRTGEEANPTSGASSIFGKVASFLAAEGGLGEWQAVNEAMSERAAAYQTQITGQSGQAYVVNGVKFDGISGNTLLDAKGPGYANFVDNGEFQPWFSGQQSLINQARSQIGAAGGAPIQWHIAEGEALPALQNLFQQNGITGVQLIHTPAIP